MPLRLACSGGQLDENAACERKKIKSPNKIDVLREASELECPICLDHIDNARATLCKPVPHVFCKECIEGCFHNGKQTINCPSCRTQVKAKDLCDVNIIDPTGTIKENDQKEPVLKPAKKAQNKTIDDIMFKSKFKRLVEELRRIRDKEPQSKSLVFSQFFSTLQWMKQEVCPCINIYFTFCYLFLSFKTQSNSLNLLNSIHEVTKTWISIQDSIG